MSASFKFSRSQLQALGQMTCLAMLVAQSIKEKDRESYTAWEEVYLKIIGAVKDDPQLASGISYQEDDEIPMLDNLSSDQSLIGDCLDEFRDSVFWDELVVRMADKALIERLGEAVFNGMPESERRRMTESLEPALWDEVSQHGIERLEFVLPPTEF